MTRLTALLLFFVPAALFAWAPAVAQDLDAACLPNAIADIAKVSSVYTLARIETGPTFNGQTKCSATFVLAGGVLAIPLRYGAAAAFTEDPNQLACLQRESATIRDATTFEVTYVVAKDKSVSRLDSDAQPEVAAVITTGQLPGRDDTLAQMAAYNDEQLWSALVESCVPKKEEAAGPADVQRIVEQVTQCLNLPAGRGGRVVISMMVDADGNLRGSPAVVGGDASDAMQGAAIRAAARCGPYALPSAQRIEFELNGY